MRASVQTTLVYLLISHIILFTTSPAYKHELKRSFIAFGNLVHKSSFGYLGIPADTWRQHPRSGLYSSTELLHSMQQHMQLNASQGLYTANDLVAYMSAGDVIRGQGWPARATLFMQLMAPRYTLLPTRNAVLEPNMELLSLAAADLPAVGRVSLAEDPRVGFRISCKSPILQYSLGPQPAATCRVYPRAATAKPPAHLIATAALVAADSSRAAEAPQMHAVTAQAAAAAAEPLQSHVQEQNNSSSWSHSAKVAVAEASGACGTCPASWGLYTVLQKIPGICCARQLRKHLRPLFGKNRSTQEPIATWTVLPTGVETASGFHDGRLALLNDPGLTAEPAPGSLLALLHVFDEWLIFPRTPLLRLLPAMSGLQQLMYGYAVLMYTWADLLWLISTMQRLHLRSTATFLAGHRWSILTAICSVTVQLVVLVLARLVVTTTLSVGALLLLNQLLWLVKLSATAMQLPTLKWMGFLLWVRGHLGWGWCVAAGAAVAAAGGAALGAVSGQSVQGVAATALLSGIVSVASGPLHRYAPTWARWWGGSGAVGDVAGEAAAGASAAVAAAQVAAGSVDSTTAAARVLRKMLLPHYGHLLSVHYLCEDLVLLTAARLVWEVTDIVFDFVWRLLILWAVEVQVLLEASAAAAAMLLQGASWQAAYGRARQIQDLQLEQRRAEAVADNPQHNRVQAQVFLQAPGDIGQAAEALRNLADELENLAHQPLGFMGAFGGLGNLLNPHNNRRRPRVQMLGEHWPVPLEIPFDSEDVLARLGVEVPRGFICPITQDVMKLPALLISSTVAVPATYDRDAISRWLEASRLDPKSRQPIAADAQLVPNMDLYRSIEDWASEKQQQMTQKQQQEQLKQGPGTASGSGKSSAVAAAAGAAAENHQQLSSSTLQTGLGGLLTAAEEAVLGTGWGRSILREQAAAAAAGGGGEHQSDLLTDSEDPDFSIGGSSHNDDTSSCEGSDFLTSEALSDNADGLLSDDDVAGPSAPLESGRDGPSTAAVLSSKGQQNNGGHRMYLDTNAADGSGVGRYHFRRRPSSVQPSS